MKRPIERWFRDDSGQDLIEYALLTAFISLVAVALITNIGTVVDSWYGGYDATIKTIPSGGS